VSRTFEVRVDASRCTRCGACAALAPALFDVRGDACRVARQPIAGEHLYADAARLVCPTDAIRATAVDDAGDDTRGADADDDLFDRLLEGAETVRWALADVRWSDLDPSLAPPELRVVVREMAFSENATYSATQRFLDAFSDDVDFSRWVAVWFYEETRHPFVLVEWLRRVGEHLPADFTSKGRVSTPLMRSVTGTLVTNVVSEITASQAYRYLARTSPEPVLRALASRIAGDEARHGASFFRFARRHLARTPEANALRERARGLEVLHAWLDASANVTHPVQQMVERLRAAPTGSAFDLDFASIRLRVVRVVGALLDVPLARPEDVAPALRDVLMRSRGTRAPESPH
jgi:ferredoxin